MLGEKWLRSDAMSETLVLKLVLARLEGSGRIAEKRFAPTAAELGPREGWTWGWSMGLGERVVEVTSCR
jgi:hypothetical protein